MTFNTILSQIPIYKFKVTMISNSPVKLHSWNNSTIRGALGTKLIQKFCTNNPVMTCESCSKSLQCSACILYHTGTPNDSSQNINPYIVSCEDYIDDQELIFSLTVFANGVNTMNDIFSILKEGLTIGKSLTMFKLKSIEDYYTNQPIFDGYMWCAINPHYIEYTQKEYSRLTIKFITPYHIKANANSINFEYILRSALRRVTALCKQSNIPIDLNYKQLLDDAKNIKTIDKNIRLKSYSRYSNRTHQSMNIMGYIGSISFEGNLTQYIPIFKLCEYINIGKLCVMNFGQIYCS